MAKTTAPRRPSADGNDLPGRDSWQQRYDRTSPAEKRTLTGLPLQPLYDPSDLGESHFEDRERYPGEFPYTRGVYPSMYRDKLWTMRQFAGFGSATDTNERYK